MLTEVVLQALQGGVKAVQLREKDLSSAELYRLATELRCLTREYGARLLINDRADIALAVGADGVQLGINSMPVTAARRLLGRNRYIGYSAHDIAEARLAQGGGADFVTFSPVYYTPSKAAYGQPCGVNVLSDAACALDIPVFALGGITQDSIADVMAAGVRGIALISAVIAASDPQAAARFLLKKIEEHAIRP